MQYVSDAAELASLYPPATADRPQRVRHVLEVDDMALLSLATLAVVATVDGDGLACSPRGGTAGSLAIAVDDHTVWLADHAAGRIHETVRNLLGDPRIGLLLLAPDRHDGLRIRGVARVSVDPEAVAVMTTPETPVSSVIVVDLTDVRRTGRGPLGRAGLWPATEVVPG